MLKDVFCCFKQDTSNTLRLDNPTMKKQTEDSQSKEIMQLNLNLNSNIKSKILTNNSEEIIHEGSIDINTLVENGLKNDCVSDKFNGKIINLSKQNQQSIKNNFTFKNKPTLYEKYPLELNLSVENSIKRALILNKSSSFSSKKCLYLESSSSCILNYEKLKITPSGLTNSLRKSKSISKSDSNSNSKDGLVIFGFKNNDQIMLNTTNNHSNQIDNESYDYYLDIYSNIIPYKNEKQIAFFIYYSNDLFYIRNYERKISENMSSDPSSELELKTFLSKFPNTLLFKIEKFHIVKDEIILKINNSFITVTVKSANVEMKNSLNSINQVALIDKNSDQIKENEDSNVNRKEKVNENIDKNSSSIVEINVYYKYEKKNSYRFNSDDFTILNIGRSDDCEIKLDFDKTYSKYQCSLNWHKEKKIWYISDGINGKPSKNGTWILVGKSIPLLENSTIILSNNCIELKISNDP